MFDDMTEDNTPILKELDSTITQEPTLEEVNKEEDHLEFTNNTTWTFTAEDRTKENNTASLEEPVLTGGSSSSGTTGNVSEVSPTPVKARVAEIEKVLFKRLERNILVKEAKDFREQYENNTLTEAPLEAIRPTGTSTGEGAWPGAPAAQYSAPAIA